MTGYHTLTMPRPQTANRPAMPVVPIERVRPVPKPAAAPPVAQDEITAVAAEMRAAEADRLSVRNIVREVAERHGLPPLAVLGRSVRSAVVRARHEAMIAVWRAYPERTLLWVARQFGRDHTTLIYVLKRAGLWQAGVSA